tara:strand:- start:1603 stop:3081 length:1479 start_codon:yes stop_codon:yes gene_type:complete
MANWWDKYMGGGTSSSSTSNTASNQGDDNKGNQGNQSSSFGNTYTGNQGNANDAGGSTVMTNKDTSVPKQENPYLVGTTKEELDKVGFSGVGGTPVEKRRETSGYDPTKNEGGTITETTEAGVTTTTNALGDNPQTTFVPAGGNNDSGDDGGGEDDNTEETEDLLGKLFDDEREEKEDDKVIDDIEERVRQLKAQTDYNNLNVMTQMQVDKVIEKIRAGEYFGSDFAAMQGSDKTGNELLAGNNKDVSDITEDNALDLFRIATQNKNATTAREVGFSDTAEKLLKAYVDSLPANEKTAFAQKVREQAAKKFQDPRNQLLDAVFRDRNLLKNLTGLSTLNQNQLELMRAVESAQQYRDQKSDNTTGQVTTDTSTNVGTDTTEQGENTGYGTAIGSNETLQGFIDQDGDGIDDRLQAGPGQPYQGPPRGESNVGTGTGTAGTTALPEGVSYVNPSGFGNTALSGVYNMIPVRDRFTGQIRYIRQPVQGFGSIIQ